MRGIRIKNSLLNSAPTTQPNRLLGAADRLMLLSSSSSSDAPPPPPMSLSTWLLSFTLLSCIVLVAAILGSSYTGLSGDWLSADVLLGGEIYLAQVGLTDVRLQNERGSQVHGLPALCGQTASTTSTGGGDSVWCQLDTIGADTETMLTIAFVPALMVIGLSLLTVLRNCCGSMCGSVHDGGCQSTLYNGAMLLCMLVFWVMTASGLTYYAYHAPATLGMGATAYDRSYGLLRACVLYASLGSVALLARALSLWDTQTAQQLLHEALQARFQKQWLYWMLSIQLTLYLVVALAEFDYAAIVPLLGLNYLSSKSPQMLWAYILLTLVTLPQDAVALARYAHGWEEADPIDFATRVAFFAVVLLKGAILLGMGMLHTRFRFRLQFFEEGTPTAEPPKPGRAGYLPGP